MADSTPGFSSATALDRNTGLPVSLQGLSFTQDQVTTTAPTTDVVTTGSSGASSQSGSSASRTVNTTPTALAALDQLILQLMGNSSAGISGIPGANSGAGDLKVLFPDAPQEWDIEKGLVFVDPTTGRRLSTAEATMFNAGQEAKRVAYAKGEIDASGRKLTPGSSGGNAASTVAQNGVSQPPGVATGELGTPAQRRQIAARELEINRNRTQQGLYSKDAAFTDAQFLMNKALHDALEQALPGITAASEGAGTSKGSMRALLTQRAAETGAREGAALGAGLSVQYGGLSNQLASTLELLTRSDPNSPENLLLQAIIGSKGLISESTSSQVQSGSSSNSGSQVTNQGPRQQQVTTTKQPLLPSGVGDTGQTTPTIQDTAPKTTPYLSISVTPQDQESSLDQSYSGIFDAGDVNIYDMGV